MLKNAKFRKYKYETPQTAVYKKMQFKCDINLFSSQSLDRSPVKSVILLLIKYSKSLYYKVYALSAKIRRPETEDSSNTKI